MSVQVASVSIGTKLDLSGFNSGLKGLKPLKISTRIDDVLIKKQFNNLEKLFKKTFVLRVDTRELDKLDSRLFEINRKIREVERKKENTVKIFIDDGQLKAVEERINILNKKVNITTAGGLRPSANAPVNPQVAQTNALLARIETNTRNNKNSIITNLKAGAASAVGGNAAQFVMSKMSSNEPRKAGEDVARGLNQGIQSQSNSVTKSGNNLADGVIRAAKLRLGIKSPSKVFNEIGQNVVDGFKQGLSEVKKIQPKQYFDTFVKKTSKYLAQTSPGQFASTYGATPSGIKPGAKYKQMISLMELIKGSRGNQSAIPQSVANMYKNAPRMQRQVQRGRNVIETNPVVNQIKNSIPKSPKEWEKALKNIDKTIDYPITLYLKYQIKGASEMYKEAQKAIGKQLDVLEKQAVQLPVMGDAAAGAVKGLKLLNATWLGGIIAGMGFFSVLGKIQKAMNLAAAIAPVVSQFNDLKKQFVLTAQEGEQSAVVFERMSDAILASRVDLATGLEGSRQIFGNMRGNFDASFAESFSTTAADTARRYSVNLAQTQQVFAAFDQLTQNAVLSTSSIRQLQEVAPGTFELMAQSMGMTNQEFDVMVSSGHILTSDFLPRFKEQLDQVNLANKSESMDTLAAATGRYNNALINLQRNVGKNFLGVEKIRLNVLSEGLERVAKLGELFATWVKGVMGVAALKLIGYLKNIAVALFPLLTKGVVLKGVLVGVGGAIVTFGYALVKVLPILLKIGKEVLYFQLAFDMLFTVLPKLTKTAGGAFTKFADTAVSNIQSYREALAEARQETKSFIESIPKLSKDVQGESTLEDTALGLLFGKQRVRKTEQAIQKFLGLRTFAQKQMEDSLLETGRLQQAGGSIVDDLNKFRTIKPGGGGGITGELKEYVELQKKIGNIRGSRRAILATNPSDKAGLRQLKDQEKLALERASKLGKPITGMQSALTAQIRLYQDALSEYDRKAKDGEITQDNYLNITNSLNVSLREAEKAQAFLNKHIKDGADALSNLKSRAKDLQTGLSDGNDQIERTANLIQTNISNAIASGDITAGQAQFASLNSELKILSDRLQLNKITAFELREALDIAGSQKVLEEWGVKPNAGAAQFAALAQKAEKTENFKEQEIFLQYQKLAEFEQEASNMQSQIAQRNADIQQQLFDVTKQVDSYYKQISRQAKETSLAYKAEINKLNVQSAATDLRLAISGNADNIVTSFADNMISAIETLTEAANSQIDSESKTLQSQYQLEDTLKEGNNLKKQLPAIEVELDFSSIPRNNDLSQLSTEVGNAIGSTHQLGNSFNQALGIATNLKGEVGNITTSVQNTTNSANVLQGQIDNTTLSTQITDTATKTVGLSIDQNIKKTIDVGTKTTEWNSSLDTVNEGTLAVNAGFEKIGESLLDVINKTVDWFKTLVNNTPLLKGIAQRVGGFVGGMADSHKHAFNALTGRRPGAGGAFASGLYTGEASKIGGSSAYHIDSKILKSVGADMAIKLIDSMVSAYEKQGRRMEFSNSAVSGKVWDRSATTEAKKKLLAEIDAAHSHSPNPKYWDFDYYLPKKGESRHEGASLRPTEMMLPQLPGGSVKYGRGSRYGNFATIYDASGNMVMKTGHGDNTRRLPQNRTFDKTQVAASGGGASIASSAQSMLASMGSKGAGRIPRGGSVSQAERVKSDAPGANALVATAQQLGLNPAEFAALMSWESGGTLNPNVKGGDRGVYKGLIQFSPDNQRKYGTTGQQSISQQMPAIAQYLQDRGFKPGEHDIRHAYSAILAGQASEKYWNRKDSNGTSVRNAAPKFQRGEHRQRAEQFLRDSGIDLSNFAPTTQQTPLPTTPEQALPQLWTPQSVTTSGNARITEAQGLARQQQQQQAEITRRQSQQQRATDLTQSVIQINQGLVTLKRELKNQNLAVESSTHETVNLIQETTNTALTIEQQAQKAKRDVGKQYTDLENSLLQQKERVTGSSNTAKQLIAFRGRVTPELEESVRQLLKDDGLPEALKEKLRQATETGALGDDGLQLLQQVIASGEQNLKTIDQNLSRVRSERTNAMKSLDDKYKREEGIRKREAQGRLNAQQLEVKRQQLEAFKLAAGNNPLGEKASQISTLEQEIALLEEKEAYTQKLADAEQHLYDKKMTQEEYDKYIQAIKSENEARLKNIQTTREQADTQFKLNQAQAVFDKRQRNFDIGSQLTDALARSAERSGITSANDPLKMRYDSERVGLQLELEGKLLDLQQLQVEGKLTADEIANLTNQYNKLNEVKLENLANEFEKNVKNRAIELRQRLGGSAIELLNTRSEFLGNRGLTIQAQKLQKQTAQAQQQLDYESQKRDLEEFIKSQTLSTEQANQLRSELEQINQIKFDTIQDNFNAFKPVIDGVQSELKTFFSGVIKSGKNISEIFNSELFDNLLDGILSSVVDLGSNYIVESLFGNLLGGSRNEGKGGMFAKSEEQSTNPLDAILGTGNKGEVGQFLGKSPASPMFVSVTNATTAFGQLSQPQGVLGGFGKKSFTNPLSLFGGEINKGNPFPVAVEESAPDAFAGIASSIGSIFGGSAGGGFISNALGAVTGAIGGGGFGGILSTVLSFIPGFSKGGIIGNGQSGKDDQLILAQRGEGILTHAGMKALGGARALEAINRTRLPRYANGGVVGSINSPKVGEYGGSAVTNHVASTKYERRNVNVKFETTRINNVDYVTKDQAEQIGREAAREGAKQGYRAVTDKMQNSVTFRNNYRL